MRYISRDAFARTSLVRRNSTAGTECRWCGQKPEGRRRLYNYGTQHPMGTVSWGQGSYCSKSCWEAH